MAGMHAGPDLPATAACRPGGSYGATGNHLVVSAYQMNNCSLVDLYNIDNHLVVFISLGAKRMDVKL
jgi:hypothetical protein